MNNYDTLLSALNKGYYLDNFYEISKICKDLSTQNTQDAWIFFIFDKLFCDLAYDWEDRLVKASEAENLEKSISPPIKEIIINLKERKSISKTVNNVNILVLAFSHYMSINYDNI